MPWLQEAPHPAPRMDVSLFCPQKKSEYVFADIQRSISWREQKINLILRYMVSYNIHSLIIIIF